MTCKDPSTNGLANLASDPARAPCPRALGLVGLLAVLLGAGLPGGGALAQDRRQEAADLFQEGNTMFGRGDYQGALERYRRARALYPSYKIDLNIGGALDALGRAAEATVYLETFLQQAGDLAPREISDAARSRLVQLRRKLASVTLSCSVTGARVSVNGREEGRTPLPTRIYLQPGTHRLLVEKDGRKLLLQSLTLAAGEHQILDTDRPYAATGPAPSPVRYRDQRRRKSLWAYTTLAVAAALAAGGAVLYGVGKVQGDTAHDLYRDSTTPKEIAGHWEDVESARTMFYGGHVLMGTAAVALGISLYCFLTRPAAPAPRRQASSPAGRESAGLVMTGHGLGLAGSF